MNKPADSPCMLLESSLQLNYNFRKHSIVLADAHILQEAKDWLSSLLEGEYNSIISKSLTDVGKPNLIQREMPTEALHANHAQFH